MTDTTIQTDDGGHVTMTVDGSAGNYTIHVQKYDASGAPVGSDPTPYNSYDPPKLVALDGGGYVLAGTVAQRYGATFGGTVFDASGARVGGFSAQTDGHLAASPLGGFVVTSIPGAPAADQIPRPTTITLYDVSGHPVDAGTVMAYGSAPTISVDGDGLYHVSWTDGSLQHQLAIDPRNPPDLTPPPNPGAFQLVDDQGPQTGLVAAGGATDDTTPTIRVPVTEVGAVAVSSSPSRGEHFVAVTQADVDRGYIDVALRTSGGDGTFSDGAVTVTARAEDSDGIISGQTSETFTIDTATPGAPSIAEVKDDEGAQTGDVVNGQTTDDTTPTVTVSFFNSHAHIGDIVVLHDSDGSELGRETITNSNVGQTQFSFETELAYGTHTLTADIVRSTGVTGPDSAPISFTIQDPSAPAEDHAPAFKTTDGGVVADGGTVSQMDVLEANFPHGTQPQNSLTVTRFGSIYLSAQDGLKDLTIDGHAILTNGAFSSTGFDFDGVNHIFFNDYDSASGKLSFTYGLRTPVQQDPGVESTTFTLDAVLTDTDGDATHAQMAFRVVDDAVVANTDLNVAQIGGAAVTGNLLTNDQGADGVSLQGLAGAAQTSSGYTVQGQFGVLTVSANGDYSYTANAGAQPGLEHFSYDIGDNDNDRATGSLNIEVRAPASGSGEVITASRPGDTLTGGSGDDTINASQGPDVITTGAGADVVAFHDLPWSSGHVTDFTLGTDHLDFSALFAAAGYSGSDPVADGRMTFQANGSGGTTIYFDHDQAGGGDWPFRIITLDHVSASGLTWAQLSTGAPPTSPPPPPPPPPPSSGEVITSPAPGSTVSGTSGSDTIYASQGPDTITSGAGDDVVAFRDLPWNAGHVTDFQLGSDHLDLSAIFQASGYTGSDPVADGRMRFEDDGAGGTKVFFDRDQPNGGDWPFLITTLDHVSANGLTWAQIGGGGGAGPAQGAPAITQIVDDVGPQQGPLVAGASTDDTDLALTFSIQGTGARDGDALVIYDNGQQYGGGPIHADDVQAGQFSHTIRFAEGSHSVTVAVAQDGHLGPQSAAFAFTVQPDGTPGQVITSDQYGDTLVGGSGGDTLNAGQGPDTLTGNGGADHFVFNDLPWRAGAITDFTPGVDKLDLRPLFQAAGYSGTDPLADHHLEFRDDGQGGTAVYFDHDQTDGGDWPFLITTLQGVTPGQVSPGDWLFR